MDIGTIIQSYNKSDLMSRNFQDHIALYVDSNYVMYFWDKLSENKA